MVHGPGTFRLLLVLGMVTTAAPVAHPQSRGRVLLAGGERKAQDALPPELPWEGRSRSLLRDPKDAWATPFEKSGGTRTPGYEETIQWLQRLAEAAPQIRMVSLGKSPEGRDLWLVVASAAGASTPEALRDSGKPVLFAQAGIHAGEIDGKDAGMMLLRDLTVGDPKHELLGSVSVLFVPILNVDGHERFSPYGRINQRGPEECGWRTNASNLNLNRDFVKLDAVETRYLVTALHAWEPDLYLDLHVSDGYDQQYDITWSYNGPHAWSPNIGAWLDAVLSPALTGALRSRGHVPGPFVGTLVRGDPSQGISFETSSPRFSNGYGDARHLPTVLVESHALKPYVQRVLGNYVFMESALRTLASQGRQLRQAATADRKLRRSPLPLEFAGGEPEPEAMEFLGVRSRLSLSAISGGLRREWTGEPETFRVTRVIESEPKVTAPRPLAYWIPPAWTEVIERLQMHGIRLERQEDARELPVTMYRIENPKLAANPFEGRVGVTGTPVPEPRTEHFPPGSVRVPTDQPLGDLVMLLLEPGSPDSFFQWGFFHSILQVTEYVEAYVMEAFADEMLASSPTLAAEFQEKLASDSEFAKSAEQRLQWFYRKTPYADERWRLYPVAREE